ncbi:MAG: hypothetical protein C4299_04080 [Thermoleophilia bacterium]
MTDKAVIDIRCRPPKEEAEDTLFMPPEFLKEFGWDFPGCAHHDAAVPHLQARTHGQEVSYKGGGG